VALVRKRTIPTERPPLVGEVDMYLRNTIHHEKPFTSGKVAAEPSVNMIKYFSDFQIVLLGSDSTDTFRFGEPYYELRNKTYLFP
jgi:hypothetical protein